MSATFIVSNTPMVSIRVTVTAHISEKAEVESQLLSLFEGLDGLNSHQGSVISNFYCPLPIAYTGLQTLSKSDLHLGSHIITRGSIRFPLPGQSIWSGTIRSFKRPEQLMSVCEHMEQLVRVSTTGSLQYMNQPPPPPKFSKELKDFFNQVSQLSSGWVSDDSQSEPPTTNVVTNTKDFILKSKNEYGEPSVGALPEGGLEMYWKSFSIYLGFYNSGKFKITKATQYPPFKEKGIFKDSEIMMITLQSFIDKYK